MATPTLANLKKDFERQATPARAKSSQWFFKTDPGHYGHGDKFLGLAVPLQRQLAKKYHDLPLPDVISLLKSPYHEHRLTAVFILTDQYRRGDITKKKIIATAYLKHRAYVNNWDIVDSSAPHILGAWLLDKPRTVLYRLVRSRSLWDRRIAILATQTFIRHGDFTDTFKLARLLLDDREDLIHKGVGWMVREVGNRDRKKAKQFLDRHAPVMPRTMLRYAIETFPTSDRQRYLQLSLPK